MQAKLTLRLESKLVRRAKAFAKKTGKSVSQMVADYFSLLEEPLRKPESQLTPLVRSLKGSLHGDNISVEDYHRHL